MWMRRGLSELSGHTQATQPIGFSARSLQAEVLGISEKASQDFMAAAGIS